MNRIDIRPSRYIELVASHLRSQLVRLHSTLETIERTHSYEDDYVQESLKTVEYELRRLRKFIELTD